MKSPDGFFLEDNSPSHQHVTFRKFMPNSDAQELHNDFQSFQMFSIVAMLATWLAKQDNRFSKSHEDFNYIRTSIKFMNESYEDLGKLRNG